MGGRFYRNPGQGMKELRKQETATAGFWPLARLARKSLQSRGEALYKGFVQGC